jgi:hypothetical protein
MMGGSLFHRQSFKRMRASERVGVVNRMTGDKVKVSSCGRDDRGDRKETDQSACFTRVQAKLGHEKMDPIIKFLVFIKRDM